jgi:hypothetical protein
LLTENLLAFEAGTPNGFPSGVATIGINRSSSNTASYARNFKVTMPPMALRAMGSG